ncbi:MAG: hypothetical protein LBH76_07865, partial [Propionibacteriaceae bacterium]|nr:hypothetical protein [Propionibacteriaceae bacterium]
MSKPVKFGVVGLDHWYSSLPFVRSLIARADTELVAVADLDPGRAVEQVDELRQIRLTSDPQELYDDGSIEVIVS